MQAHKLSSRFRINPKEHFLPNIINQLELNERGKARNLNFFKKKKNNNNKFNYESKLN